MNTQTPMLRSLLIAGAAVFALFSGGSAALAESPLPEATPSAVLQSLPFTIPASQITVTASSTYSDAQAPAHLVDGSGMTEAGHDNATDASTMWHTIDHPNATVPAPGLPESRAWVRFDFAATVLVERLLIWNQNQAQLTDRGFCTTGLYGSTDGNNWFALTPGSVVVLPKSSGTPGQLPVVVPNSVAERPLKSVIIEAEAPGDNYGGTAYGLSAVRFVVHRLPVVMGAEGITVTASSTYDALQASRHLVDGSGMIGALHDNAGDASTMWQSAENPASTSPAQGLPASPAWVRFDFVQPATFASILIWNLNQARLADRGLRMVRVVGSSDGIHWRSLTATPTIVLPRAPADGYSLPTRIDTVAASEHPLTSVIIAAESGDGNYGSNCYGLSAVRFVISR